MKTDTTNQPQIPLILRIVGLPRPQPRPCVTREGHAYNPPSADAWKARVGLEARAIRGRTPLAGPIRVDVIFLFPRPLSHFIGRRPERGLRPGAPVWHDIRPDRDNLDKAILDALTRARLWGDDAQIADGRIQKRYAAAGEPSGAVVTIGTCDD